jgi:sec-independent protein translocase protein TatA
MGTFSPFHWLVVILVLVLLFGSKKIPDLAKSLGLGIKEFKKATKDGDKEDEASTNDKKSATEKLEKKDDAKS